MDAGVDLGIAHGLELELIEIAHAIEEPATHGAVDALGIRYEEDGLALRPEIDALMIAGQKPIAPIPGQQRLVLSVPRGQHDKRGQLLVFAAQAIR